jgi:hypothetical protein
MFLSLSWLQGKKLQGGIPMYTQKTNFYTADKKRFYTPQFSEMASVTVRRLAWALNIPMTKAVDFIINELSLIISSSIVCPKCKDNTKCQFCAFSKQATLEKAA